MRAKPILAAALPWHESLDRSCRSGAFAAIAPGAALLQFQVAYRYGGETHAGECQPVTDEMRAKPILAGALPWRESLDRSCRSGALAAIAPGAALLQLPLGRTNSGQSWKLIRSRVPPRGLAANVSCPP